MLQGPPQADGTIPYYLPLTLDMLSDKDEDRVLRLLQGVTNGSCIVCAMVVGLNVPTPTSRSL